MTHPLPMPRLPESTSAELRRVKAELGSALRALARTEAERDQLAARYGALLADRDDLAVKLASARTQLERAARVQSGPRCTNPGGGTDG